MTGAYDALLLVVEGTETAVAGYNCMYNLAYIHAYLCEAV